MSKISSTKLSNRLQKRFVFFGVFLLLSVFFLKSDFFCAEAAAFCAHPSETQQLSTQIASNYFTYSDESFQKALVDKKIIILYFYAPWCTSCTNFDQELTEKSKTIPENVIIFQIPYDTATELKAKYQVSYQHTLVLLDEQGEIKEMWIGGDLQSVLDYLRR